MEEKPLRMQRLFLQAEVKHIGLHGFRHTYARLYLESGGTLADLQHILGPPGTGGVSGLSFQFFVSLGDTPDRAPGSEIFI